METHTSTQPLQVRTKLAAKNRYCAAIFGGCNQGSDQQLAVTMLTASAGRRVEVELRSLNERLEHGVRERTQQLTTLNEELRKEIVERQRAQDALHESQDKLAHVTRVLAMGELAASIAHEVNQPLTSVVTNAGFRLRELAGASPGLEELREALTEIVSDGNRASAVLARVRSFLARGAPERREVDINEAIQRSLASCIGLRRL